MKSFLIIFILIAQASYLLAQQSFMKQFTDEEGLPSMTIYCIAQDNDGFLWIGTDNGLSRFDGEKFQTIKHPNAVDNEYIGIYHAPNGVIWTWNLSGELYRVLDNELERYTPESLPKQVIFTNLIGDELGNIYIGHHNWNYPFYYVCNGSDSCYETPKHKDFVELSNFLLDAKASNPEVFINIRNGGYNAIFQNSVELAIVKERGFSRSTRFDYFPSKSSKVFGFNRTSKNIFNIKISKRGAIGVEDIELNRLHPTLSLGYIRIFYNDKEGNYWIADNKHLYQFDEKFNLIQDVSPLLENLMINHFFQDNEGGYWIGSNSNGLFYIPSFDLKTFGEQDLPLKGSQIISIESLNEDEIVVATQQGDLFRIKDNIILDHKNYTSNITLFKKSEKKGDFWLNFSNGLYLLDNNLNIKRKFGLKTSVKDIAENDNLAYVASQAS